MSSHFKSSIPLGGIIAAVTIVLVVSAGVSKGHRPRAAAPVRVATDVAVNVSLIQLIATPEKFDGRRIVVSGFLVNEPDDQALYIGANDAINGLDNKVAVAFTASQVPQDLQDQLNREYVALRGTFKGGPQPEIGNVDHLEERHGPVKRPPLGE